MTTKVHVVAVRDANVQSHFYIFNTFSFSQIFFSCLYRVRLFVYRRATYCHLPGNVHIFIKIKVRKCYVTVCKTINNIILIF